MERRDLEDRVIRPMGAVHLVMEAHPTEEERFVGAIETPEGTRHPMTLNTSLTVMSSLCMDASGQLFDNLNDAARWMVCHALDLVGAAPTELVEATAA